jgi:hypothetical protein
VKYFFELGEHVAASDAASLVNGIAAYGNVSSGGADRGFIVDVFRESKEPRLKKLFEHNERFGFMTWRRL